MISILLKKNIATGMQLIEVSCQILLYLIQQSDEPQEKLLGVLDELLSLIPAEKQNPASL